MKKQIALFTGIAGLIVLAVALYCLRDMLPALASILTIVVTGYGLTLAVIHIMGKMGQAKAHLAQADLIKSQAALNHANAQATLIQSFQVAGNSQALCMPANAGQFNIQILPGLSRQGANAEQALPELATGPKPTITASEAMELLPTNGLSWCFGVDETGQPVVKSIEDSLHVLNVGGSGSGKTTLDANLLLQLVKRNNPALYELHLADTKNIIGKAFKPFSTSNARTGQEYFDLLQRMAALVKSRADREETDGPLVLVVIEELLTAEFELELLGKQVLAQFRANMRYIAIYGREYRVLLLNSSQLAYASSKDFAIVRAQSATRIAGYVQPQLAKTMGFLREDLAKRAWADRQPGQFLLESGGTERLIQVPRLNMKSGELVTLLGVTPTRRQAERQPACSQTDQPARATANTGGLLDDLLTWPQSVSNQTVTAQYRELPPARDEIIMAYQAYRQGATTVVKMQAALKCSTKRATDLLRAVKTDYV